MCRLAMFPPGYPKDRALEILLRFEGGNKDGVGAAYLNPKTNMFSVSKSPGAISDLVKTHDFLGHMPYLESWTIAHLRMASHGAVKMENTHPFIVGDWCFIHNGIWSDYKIAKLALSKSVKFHGETDTEVAAHMFNILGPEQFTEEIDRSGVFVGLHRSGQLHVVRTSGDLEGFIRTNGTTVLASTLDPAKFKKKFDVKMGYYLYDKDGKYIRANEKKGYDYRTTNHYYGAYQNYQRSPSGSSCCSSQQQSNYPVLTKEEIDEFSEHGFNYYD